MRLTRDLAITIAAVVIASGLRILLAPVLSDRAAFQLYTIAVMISAWVGGWQKGFVATALSTAAGIWLFVEPFSVPGIHDAKDIVQISLFAATGAAISVLAGKLHSARVTAEAEARNAKQVRDEISELLESINEGFEALDGDFRLTYVNGAAERMMNRSASELIAQPAWREFPAAIGAPVESQLRGVMTDRKPAFSEQFHEPSQRWFAIHAYPFREGISVLFWDISGRKKDEQERERLIGELRQALANVRTLRGLIPICASCKKIRDDKGYWEQLEVYIRDHSEANFSHGMCPDCAEKYWALDSTSGNGS